MKIINSEVCHLSNWEVFQHLNSIKSTNTELAVLSKQINDYLLQENSSSISTLDAATVGQFLKYLDKFRLNSMEKIQILNLMPISEVELDVIVEDCPHRLNGDDVAEILQLVQDYLKPQHPQPEPEEDENVGYVDLGF